NWKTPPRTALLIKKPGDQDTEDALPQVAMALHSRLPFARVIAHGKPASRHNHHVPCLQTVCCATDDQREYERVVDFVVTLGGDGTIMHVSSLFDRRVPPIASFSMGTLGFLLPFHFKEYPKALHNLISGEASLLPRLRLECTAYSPDGQVYSQAGTYGAQVMNEVNLHRGRYPHLSAVSCYVNGEFLTDAVADGLMVATPTGSTAYSLSAGGPIVHPSVPSMLVTPVCPQSLSFRPVLLPSDVVVRLQVGASSRGLAELTIDGREICLLGVGGTVEIRKSAYPMLSVNRINEGVDWVRDINQMLKFNQGFTNKQQLLGQSSMDWS
ncbi:ATP-NAD kinase, partial [Thamnocephalis sphaerospora]